MDEKNPVIVSAKIIQYLGKANKKCIRPIWG